MGTAHAPASAAGLPGKEPGGEPDAVIHTEDLTKVYPGTDFAAVDQLNLDVRAGEIFGLLGPNGAGKTTTAGMLTTRVVPTSGRAFLAGVDVAAHPALAKQLSGIVSQQNTLDRQLTVWENLYFHGRLFGMGAKASRQIASDLLEQFQLSQVGQGVGVRAVRRHGPAAHGGAGHLPPPVGAVPRRADRGPGPAEQARAVGPARRAARRRPDDPAHHALHGGGRPALPAGRDHGPRPDPGARHAGRAQAEHRRRHHRHRADHRRPRPARRTAGPRRRGRHANAGGGRPARTAHAGRRPAGARGSFCRPNEAGSSSSTCRSPSPPWRRCSST